MENPIRLGTYRKDNTSLTNETIKIVLLIESFLSQTRDNRNTIRRKVRQNSKILQIVDLNSAKIELLDFKKE